MSSRTSDFIAVLAVLAIAAMWAYTPEPDPALQFSGAMTLLTARLEQLQTNIDRLKAVLRENATCFDYEDLLEKIDTAPGHAIVLQDRGYGKLKIWAIAAHETPEYFTSSFGVFDKRLMSSTCAVYAPVQNGGVYTSKWCP